MLNIYKIDTNYNKYLRNFDKNVVKNYDEKAKRPYIGLLIEVDSIYYKV